MGDRRRIPAVEGARGVAALSVLTFHVLQTRGELNPVFERLWLGVPLFFVISGFVLFRPFCRTLLIEQEVRPTRRYALARGLRIFPALWAMTAVALVLLYPDARGGVLIVLGVGVGLLCVVRQPWRVPLGSAAMLLLGIGAYLSAHAGIDATTTAVDQFTLTQLFTLARPTVLVGPVWTLCIEVSFYALLPALAIGMQRAIEGRRVSRPLGILSCLIALAAMGLAYSQFMGWGYGLPTLVFGFLPQFAAGMGVALAADAGWGRRGGRALLGTGIAVAACGLAIQNFGPANNTDQSGPLFGAVIGLAFALLLASVVLPQRRNALGATLSSRPLVVLGTISYGIYLWHYPAIMWLSSHDAFWSTAIALPATLACTIALATVSWRLIEAPALRFAHATRDPAHTATSDKATVPVTTRPGSTGRSAFLGSRPSKAAE